MIQAAWPSLVPENLAFLMMPSGPLSGDLSRSPMDFQIWK
jgi:hypothetical protein